MGEKYGKISAKLLQWYYHNKRDLPWRNTSDPYKIWLSEVILQQTRVEQGTPYYLRFISEFPTVIDLARASEKSVMKLWQGLGYYSRARNLHHTAKEIANTYQGNFPDAFHDLVKLKGIGEYTASAICSIAYSLPYAVVDGNVIRVIARLFGLKGNMGKTAGIKEVKELAAKILDKCRPGDSNQSVMEFGALVCTPANPACNLCCLSGFCEALKIDRVEDFPAKYARRGLQLRWFNYLVLIDKDYNLLVNRRGINDIWGHLYEFPLIETPKQSNANDLIIRAEENSELQISGFKLIENVVTTKHKLSHQQLNISFFVFKNSLSVLRHTTQYEKLSLSEFTQLPVPKPISDFFEKKLKKMQFNREYLEVKKY